MTAVLSKKSPRWLGWVLVVVGSLLAILMAFIAFVLVLFGPITFALYDDEAWGAVVGTVLVLSMGVFGAIGGVRILRGTPPREATSTASRG